MQNYFDMIWNFVIAYWQPIVAILLLVIGYIVGAETKIATSLTKISVVIVSIVTFFSDSLSEPDEKGGKASFTRIAGTYIILNIVSMCWEKLSKPTYAIPAEMMTLFWVTVGILMLIKAYKTAGDHLDSIFDGLAAKWSNGLILPGGQVGKPFTAAPPATTTQQTAQ